MCWIEPQTAPSDCCCLTYQTTFKVLQLVLCGRRLLKLKDSEWCSTLLSGAWAARLTNTGLFPDELIRNSFYWLSKFVTMPLSSLAPFEPVLSSMLVRWVPKGWYPLRLVSLDVKFWSSFPFTSCWLWMSNFFEHWSIHLKIHLSFCIT